VIDVIGNNDNDVGMLAATIAVESALGILNVREITAAASASILQPAWRLLCFASEEYIVPMWTPFEQGTPQNCSWHDPSSW